MLRQGSLATLFAVAILASQATALNFAVSSVDCFELQWTMELSANEWSLTSNVELFFSGDSSGAQDYSLLYSALPSGPVSSAGTFAFTTSFGATALNGRYAIGVQLLDSAGAVIVPSSSNNFIESTASDSRIYTFSQCAAEIAAGTATVSASASTISSVPSSTSIASSALPTSTTLAASSALTSTSAAAAVTASPSTNASSETAATVQDVHKVNSGAIAGGVIGGVLGVLALLTLFRYFSKRERAQKTALGARHLKAMVLARRTSSNASPEVTENILEEGGAASDGFGAHGPRSDNSHQPWSGYSVSAAPSVRSAANPFGDPAQQNEEPLEIKMVQVPFQLSPPSFPIQQHSAEVPLHRVSSTPTASRATPSPQPLVEPSPSDFVSESAHTRASRPVSSASPTMRNNSGSPQIRSVSNFKIPRVSVPTYSDGSAPRAVQTPSPRGQHVSEERRPSPAADSTMTVEDPFVDATQAESPLDRRF